VDRFRIEVDRETREASAPEKIEISAEEMQAAVLPAIGETLATSCRFIDGGLSISCKVTTTEKSDLTYVVQIRHHGNVASMDSLMKYVQHHSEPGILPMPAVFSIPGEAAHQAATGFRRTDDTILTRCDCRACITRHAAFLQNRICTKHGTCLASLLERSDPTAATGWRIARDNR
jgi:hypothetical protein